MTYCGRSLLALACAVAFPIGAHAEAFPTKPITLIVPFPAGSQPDTIARFVAQHLSSRIGTTVVQNSTGRRRDHGNQGGVAGGSGWLYARARHYRLARNWPGVLSERRL